MNKAQLVEEVLKDKKAGFESRAAAERACNKVIEYICDGVERDGQVQIKGLGTFSQAKSKTSEGPSVINFTDGSKAGLLEMTIAQHLLGNGPGDRSGLLSSAVLKVLRDGVNRDRTAILALGSYSIAKRTNRSGRNRPRPRSVIIQSGPIKFVDMPTTVQVQVD